MGSGDYIKINFIYIFFKNLFEAKYFFFQLTIIFNIYFVGWINN